MIVIAIVAAIVFAASVFVIISFSVGRGTFGKRVRLLSGNGKAYTLETVTPVETTLTGKKVCFLGSSVTFGTASGGVSFVEFLARRDGIIYKKEAVAGTTLTAGKDSYIDRLHAIREKEFDLFVCQLSTNDAAKKRPPGETESTDTNTVCGAINHIIDYVKDKWNCPIVFFTNPYYENAEYAAMVDAVNKIVAVKKFSLIDLYSDKDFNAITSKQRALFMADKIHPTKAGYKLWWMPEMERRLIELFSAQ